MSGVLVVFARTSVLTEAFTRLISMLMMVTTSALLLMLLLLLLLRVKSPGLPPCGSRCYGTSAFSSASRSSRKANNT